MIIKRREIFMANRIKSNRFNELRYKRTQIIKIERRKYQNQEEKRLQLKLLVPDILDLQHSRQNYHETMLIPVSKIFKDLDFADQEIFEVIDLYLNYEVQFIKQFTFIEMRSAPNFQDDTTQQVLEYLSNLIFGPFEVEILIGSEIIEQLSFIVCNGQHPWILEQTCYTILQLLIIDDEEIIQKFKQLKMVSPIVENVLRLGYFQNKYFIELVTDIIIEFASFDIHRDYGDCLYVVILWCKISKIEYDDPLFQIQLEASLCYVIYLLSKDYDDQCWTFIYEQEEFQQFIQVAQQRIAKLNNYDKNQKSICDAVIGYNSVFLGMIINMIQNLAPIEILHFYSSDLVQLLIIDLKSESQEIIDLNCQILQILIKCDVKIRLDLLQSGIYYWFHIILDAGFNDNIDKTQIINVLLEAIEYDDQDYILELMNQSITKALINSTQIFELSSEQLRDILNAMTFIQNVEYEYGSQKNDQKNRLKLYDSIEYALEDKKNVLLIQNKIQRMQNQKELDQLFQNLLSLIRENQQDKIKNIAQ